MPPANEQALLASTLDFFGRVTADATHDIKNELAVMNEQSRLLQEMLVMAGQGRQLRPGHLEELAGRLIARLEQANQAVRRLNAFSHSADLDHSGQAEMNKALDVMIPLYQSTAARHRVSLSLAKETPPDTLVTGSLPLVCMAIWACLESVCSSAGPGADVVVRLRGGEGCAAVCFEAQPAAHPSVPPPAVLQPAGAWAAIGDHGGLELSLPLVSPGQSEPRS